MQPAEVCNLPSLGVEREARFSPPAPNWDSFIVSGLEIMVHPVDWQASLQEWRGVYQILDRVDGARYVGSAYGEANLPGRWVGHVGGDAGITVELAKRDPVRFQFSIHELVAPTASSETVIALEQSWKPRLDTIEHGLNRN